MGLNLDRIATIKANLAAESVALKAAPAPAVKTDITDALAALATIPAPAKPALPTSFQGPNSSNESAGTIRYQEVADKIRSLDASIKAAHPTMPRLLHDVWDTLQKYPECVTILAEDEIEIVISGLEKLVDTDLAAITIKAVTGGKKSKAPVSNLSLGF